MSQGRSPERMESLKNRVIMASFEVISSRLWAEEHPEDPHHGDSLDLANDNLQSALEEWAGLRPGA